MFSTDIKWQLKCKSTYWNLLFAKQIKAWLLQVSFQGFYITPILVRAYMLRFQTGKYRFSLFKPAVRRNTGSLRLLSSEISSSIDPWFNNIFHSNHHQYNRYLLCTLFERKHLKYLTKWRGIANLGKPYYTLRNHMLTVVRFKSTLLFIKATFKYKKKRWPAKPFLKIARWNKATKEWYVTDLQTWRTLFNLDCRSCGSVKKKLHVRMRLISFLLLFPLPTLLAFKQ